MNLKSLVKKLNLTFVWHWFQLSTPPTICRPSFKANRKWLITSPTSKITSIQENFEFVFITEPCTVILATRASPQIVRQVRAFDLPANNLLISSRSAWTSSVIGLKLLGSREYQSAKFSLLLLLHSFLPCAVKDYSRGCIVIAIISDVARIVGVDEEARTIGIGTHKMFPLTS